MQPAAHAPDLGLPIATEKVEEPSTLLDFLSIEFDTRKMTMRLPRKKLKHLKTPIKEWLTKSSA